MRIMAILTPAAGRTEADFVALRVAEERAVWTLYAADVLRRMHFQPEPLRVVLEFEAVDVAGVHAHLASLPMVAAKLFDVDLIRLGPWLPFQALFADDGPTAS